VLGVIEDSMLDEPPTPFMALHSAVTLCALGQTERLDRLEAWSLTRRDRTYADVVSPLCAALHALAAGDASTSADRLSDLLCVVWRLGGSDAQREVVEDTLIAALLAAGRFDEARPIIVRRLDRRTSRRDEAFLAATGAA
jgi:hypothetical protein